MGTIRPPGSMREQKVSLKIRAMLAIVGIVLVLISTIILASLNRDQPRDTIRHSPPATLFAPPETDQ
jgi:hypothetical protein